jgi:hypothetical protein
MGAHFGMKGAAVSKRIRRFRKKVEKDRGIEKLLVRIREKSFMVET